MKHSELLQRMAFKKPKCYIRGDNFDKSDVFVHLKLIVIIHTYLAVLFPVLN